MTEITEIFTLAAVIATLGIDIIIAHRLWKGWLSNKEMEEDHE
jgi:hypothetical protein